MRILLRILLDEKCHPSSAINFPSMSLLHEIHGWLGRDK